MERIIIGSVSGVVSEIAKHTVPLLSPIARPCKPFFSYDDNFEKLNNTEQQLRLKKEELQRSIGDGVQHPEEVSNWQGEVNTICNDISRLRDERETLSGCSAYFNVKKSYTHRKTVAEKLKAADRLELRLKNSEDLWKYKIQIQNLKKKADDLTREEGKVKSKIKEGERPVSNVQNWMARVSTINPELQELIDLSSPPKEQSPDYSLLGDNVVRKLSEVERLLQEAKGFEVFSEETEQTKYKKGLSRLKEQVETLELKQNNVQCRIEPGEEPLPAVEKWLGDVKKVVDVVLPDEHSLEEHNKVTTLLEEASRLLEQEMQFTVVSRQIPPRSINYRFTVQETFRARMSILESIIEKLKEDDVNMLGIHGMGGVGKTTLAKHVGVKVISDKIVHKVIFAEVSQTPNVKTIQATIAEALGPKLEGESESGRATKLHELLKKVSQDGTEILLILDNLWEEIKLDDIGIPWNSKGVKLLLTARSHQLLSNKMESQHVFNLKALDEDDSWILFKSMASNCDHRSLESISKKIAKNCGGMPLAIVTVAKALKGKILVHEWNDALRRITNPSSENFEGITKEVYSCIRLSYDYLREDLKKIFLLSSRLGSTHDVSIQDLLRYGLGLGIVDRLLTMEDAQSSLYTSTKELKTVSLFLEAPTPNDDNFALHDIVCAVARTIDAESYVFNEPSDHLLRSLSYKNTSVEYTSITLHNIERLPVPAEWKCSNLKFLFVKSKYLWLKVTDDFFRGMSNLQVLHLIGMDLTPSPISLSVLVNLLTLCLEDCWLENMVASKDMKNLQILSFRGSNIQKLPEEMCQITDLRLLDLRDCRRLDDVPSEILSSLTQIEALYMNNTSTKVIIDDLKYLSELKILELHIGNMKMCRSLILSKDMRYKIVIGESRWFDHGHSSSISRSLKVVYDPEEVRIISRWSEEVEELELVYVGRAENLLEDINGTGFPQLMHLRVFSSYSAACLVNSACSVVLPALESLNVSFMSALKICNRSFAANSFLHLKTIKVEDCDKLNNIFLFSSFVGVLPNLTDLKAFSCMNMRQIFAIDRQDDLELVCDITLNQLRNLTLYKLPGLKGFCKEAETGSEFNHPLTLNKLWELKGFYKEAETGSEFNHPSSLFDEKIEIPNLQNLKVDENYHVEIIWHNLPTKLSSGVQNLTNLTLWSCHNLRVLFQSSEGGKHEGSTIKLSKLKHLNMIGLPKFTSLCSGCSLQLPLLEDLSITLSPELTSIFDEKVEVPNLKSLKVKNCKKLMTLFSSSMCGRLSSSCFEVTSNVEELRVSDCPSLKYLWVPKEVGEEVLLKFAFPKLTTMSLNGLPKLNSFCPNEHVVVEGPSLKSLELWECQVDLLNQAFPCVEELKLSRKDLRMSSENMAKKIKTLIVKINESEVLPLSSDIQIFQNLETLFLIHGDLRVDTDWYVKDILSYGEGKTLVIYTLSEVNFVGDQGMDLIFQNFYFQRLAVYGWSRWIQPTRPSVSLQNLTTLIVSPDSMEHIITSTMAKSLRKLKRMIVTNCWKLKEIVEDSVHLESLQFLRVYLCYNLNNLIPPSSSFPSLTVLVVNVCSKLRKILTPTVVKSLPKLKMLGVYNCGEVTEIMKNEGNEMERIVFHGLKTLELLYLSNLTCFCSGNFTLEFPLLEQLHIKGCRSMNSFCPGHLIVPILQEVQIDNGRYKLSLETNLNTFLSLHKEHIRSA